MAMGDISYDCSLEDVVLMEMLTRLKLGPLSRIEKAALVSKSSPKHLWRTSDLKHFSISK